MNSTTDYERTVHAALSETSSKFELAEALACDIAPRRGRPANGETSTDRHLAEAREKIISAGGEPRTVSTLRNYRLTALWARNPKTGEFRWLAGRSWSAHDEARQRGLSWPEFTRLPADAGVTVIREMGVHRGPAIAPSAAPEIGQGISPVTFLSPGEEPGKRKKPEAVPDPAWAGRESGALSAPEPGPGAAPKPELGPAPEPRPAKPLHLVTALHALRKPVARIAAEVQVNGVTVADRGPMLAELEDLTSALEAMRKDIREAGRIRAV